MSDAIQAFNDAGGFTKPDNLGLFLAAVKQLGWESGAEQLVAILLFILIHEAWKKATFKTGPDGYPTRAVWMWDQQLTNKTEMPSDQAFITTNALNNPGKYLDWCVAQGVDAIWGDFIMHLNDPTKIGNFFGQAADRGIATHMLFASTCNMIWKPKTAVVQEVNDITACLSAIKDKSLYPTALQSNYEARPAPGKSIKNCGKEGSTIALGGKDDALDFYDRHVDAKLLIDKFNTENGTSVGMAASVFYWWVNFYAPEPNAPLVELDGAPPPGMPYGEALMELGYDVTVQNYRSEEHLLSAPVFWRQKAKEYGRKAYIGLSVGPPKGKEAPTIHHYDEDIENLNPALAKVSDACIAAAPTGFGGVAVHDADFYYLAQQKYEGKT